MLVLKASVCYDSTFLKVVELYFYSNKLFFLVMVQMTCKRTKTAKEDLEYVVKKFLGTDILESNVRYPTDSHTQTISSDDDHQQEGNIDKDKDEKNLKPHVLWSLYLNLPASDIKLSDSAPKNIYLCSGPDLDLDFDYSVNQVSFFNFSLRKFKFSNFGTLLVSLRFSKIEFLSRLSGIFGRKFREG